MVISARCCRTFAKKNESSCDEQASNNFSPIIPETAQLKHSPYIQKIESSRATLWNTKGPLLTSLDIELTERCNNNCIHCYINQPINDQRSEEKELSTEKLKEILKEAAGLGCLTVRFTGGEPLLRDDFEELYLYVRKLGVKVLLFTNATLITPRLAGVFARVPPLEPIEISVYGMKKSSYEAITIAIGSFDAAWRGINLLIEKKIPIIIKSPVLPPNKDEIMELEAWASTIPSIVEPPSYSMFYDLRCFHDSPPKNNRIKNLRLAPDEAINIISRNRNLYFEEMRTICTRFMGPPSLRLFSCGAGNSGGCINARGFFQLCLLLRPPHTVFDLRRGSLKDALLHFFPKIRKTTATNPDYLKRCAVCFLKGLCEQCPAKSWTESGSLDTPVEYLCRIAHAQARHLGILEENENAWDVRNWKNRVKALSQIPLSNDKE